MSVPVLDVQGLKVTFRTRHGMVRAVDGVDPAVAAGEVVGIVGESGLGKSVAAAGWLRLSSALPIGGASLSRRFAGLRRSRR